MEENKLKKQFEKLQIKRYLTFIFGIFLVSLAFNLFLLPGDIVAGGVSGLSIVFKRFFNINPALFILAASVFLLIMSLIFLGKEQTAKSVIGSLMFPLFIKLTTNISAYLNLNIDNQFLIAVFGGIIFGFGAGLIFKMGFTSGGTDILNQIASKYLKISMGTATIIIDGLVVLIGGFVFGWVKFMYAVVVLSLVSIMVDKVLIGISDCKAFYIITKKTNEISKFIFEEMGHSVTIFDAKGGFSNKKSPVLFAVIPTKEYFKFRAGIHQIDEDAFFLVTDAYEVKGAY